MKYFRQKISPGAPIFRGPKVTPSKTYKHTGFDNFLKVDKLSKTNGAIHWGAMAPHGPFLGDASVKLGARTCDRKWHELIKSRLLFCKWKLDRKKLRQLPPECSESFVVRSKVWNFQSCFASRTAAVTRLWAKNGPGANTNSELCKLYK